MELSKTLAKHKVRVEK